MLEPCIIADPREWNTAISSLAQTHVLQTWEWGAFKARYGWTPSRVLFFEGRQMRAAAQILRRPLPRTGLGVLYVPKGPLLDTDDSVLFDETLAGLERIAREQRAIFIKVDPDIALSTVSSRRAISRVSPPAPEQSPTPLSSLPTGGGMEKTGGDSQPSPPGTRQSEILRLRGWRSSREQIQFRNTLLLDLSPSEEQLLAEMKPKTRYNIRLAQKRGVRVETGTRADLKVFYEMYAETGARDGFLVRPFPYYRYAWGAFIEANLAQMFIAYLGDEVIAGLILFVFGKHAWFFYGASRGAHRDAMPNHLLQWEAMCWAKAHGCAIYDFWGAPDSMDERDPLYGVYRFKEGFGGTFVQHIGAYDFIVRPVFHFLYAIVRPWYLARLRSGRAADAG